MSRPPLRPRFRFRNPLQRLGLGLVMGVLLASLLAVVPANPRAVEPSLAAPAMAGSAAGGGPPGSCLMGVYVQELRDFRFADKSLFAALRLWSVCPSAAINPLRDLVIPDANELQLGEIRTRVAPNRSGYFTANEELTWSERSLEGTFYHPWSAQNFPFDRHTISFHFETRVATNNSFVITPDIVHSGFNPHISNNDWVVRDFSLKEDNADYESNFGNPAIGERSDQAYSRLTASLSLHRRRITSFLKLCAGVYAAVTMACISFLMDPREPDLVSGRTGLVVGCLFAAIVNMQQAEATLGLSEDVTLTDLIHIVSILYILLSAVLAILSYLRCEADRADEARHLDRQVYFPIFGISFIVLNAVIISYAALIG